MHEPPEIPEDERELLNEYTASLRKEGGAMHPEMVAALDYAAKKTALDPNLPLTDTILLFGREEVKRGHAWVRYYLNELRKTGQPPT